MNTTTNQDLKTLARGPFFVPEGDDHAFPADQIQSGEPATKYLRIRKGERATAYVAVDDFFGGVWPMASRRKYVRPFTGKREFLIVPVRRARIQPKKKQARP